MKKIAKINIMLLLIITICLVGVYYAYRIKKPMVNNQPVIIPREEINITIIPGWNLRQIASDWAKKGIIKNEEELYDLLGHPAYNYRAHSEVAPVLALANESEWAELFMDKPNNVSYEGYLFPDTYRVYADAKVEDILRKIFSNLNKKINEEMRADIKKQNKTIYEVLTMASVVEKEAGNKNDMAMVADIFWRRNKMRWAMQSCATVNYITGKNDPGISAEDRKIDSLYNTYKYPGLPLGAISNPGLEAIKATIYPLSNEYWYFMSGKDGQTYWAKTLDQHNANVYKYLR